MVLFVETGFFTWLSKALILTSTAKSCEILTVGVDLLVVKCSFVFYRGIKASITESHFSHSDAAKCYANYIITHNKAFIKKM